jgi:2-polyprenyl-3-methyl-5-hydroxy-6-metoxy-1,4-benzoquinol methylase
MVLQSSIRSMNTKQFLRWCDQVEAERYSGQNTWLRHFRQEARHQLSASMAGDALDLAKTSICRRQATSNVKNGIYHDIFTPIVIVEGSRTMKGRQPILDNLDFFPGERILDIGCNLGIISHYLYDRDCNVIGCDMDVPIVNLARIISHIFYPSPQPNPPSRGGLAFIHLDLDDVVELPEMDTICLFSVIHHTHDMEENGKKIARACKRIILECRLVENGKKPVRKLGGIVWEETSRFNFRTETELKAYLPALFPGFTSIVNRGNVDKGRSIYELTR